MDQLYTQRLENIEAVLDRWLPGSPGHDWAAEMFPGINPLPPAHYSFLTTPGRDLLLRGGKRWRPLLMMLVCEALGGADAALPLAPLVEFCHNASLIHDDIEDNSVERRGLPAVHITYGVDTAINSGCFLYFLPLACIDSWAVSLPDANQSRRADVYALWAGYIRKLHLGQAIDIHWHRNFGEIPSIDEYHAMCALKTGCLARFAAELGATIAAAEAITVQRLGDAAEKLGVGFQILDDVKNVTTGLPGKKKGDDIVEGKKSLPVLLFLRDQLDKKDMVERCFNAARSGGVDAPEAEELIQALGDSGVLAEAEAQGKMLIAEARGVFAETNEMLDGFVDYIT